MPAPRTANVATTGFLQLQDLQRDQTAVAWRIDDTLPSSDVDGVGLPRCLSGTGPLPSPAPGNSHVIVDGSGADRTFVADVPGGQVLAFETVLQLDRPNTALLTEYLRQVARCTRFEGGSTLLVATDTRLITGVVQARTGALTDGSAVLLSGNRLISLSVDGNRRPTGALPIPGGQAWLAAVAATAAQRAAVGPAPGLT
ncbi:MAG: hypothetical protein WAL50_22075 [Kineosporiaceae bacterium]